MFGFPLPAQKPTHARKQLRLALGIQRAIFRFSTMAVRAMAENIGFGTGSLGWKSAIGWKSFLIVLAPHSHRAIAKRFLGPPLQSQIGLEAGERKSFVSAARRGRNGYRGPSPKKLCFKPPIFLLCAFGQCLAFTFRTLDVLYAAFAAGSHDGLRPQLKRGIPLHGAQSLA